MSYFSFTALFENELPMDLISAWAYREGCDGIEEGENTVTVYINNDDGKDTKLFYDRFFRSFPNAKKMGIINQIAEQNWNEEWKKFFKPVELGQFLVLPPWHKATGSQIPIFIFPKMAFGTGTHESTQLILESIENSLLKDKKVLDVGCGTGILSIAAEKLGAKKITGIDIAVAAIENAIENARLNGATHCHFIRGDQNHLKEENFDLIFANILAPVLKAIAGEIALKIKPGGIVFLSGLLKSDADEIEKIYIKEKFELISTNNKNEWCMLMLKKNI